MHEEGIRNMRTSSIDLRLPQQHNILSKKVLIVQEQTERAAPGRRSDTDRKRPIGDSTLARSRALVASGSTLRVLGVPAITPNFFPLPWKMGNNQSSAIVSRTGGALDAFVSELGPDIIYDKRCVHCAIMGTVLTSHQ